MRNVEKLNLLPTASFVRAGHKSIVGLCTM